MASKSRIIVFSVLIVYCTIAILALPFIGRDLPYSKFYRSSKERDKERNIKDNSVRLQQAQSTLTRFNQFSKFKEAELPEFCFVVVSVSRPVNVDFLTQVVAGLVTQLDGTNSVFTVYNAEGSTHKEISKLPSTIPVTTSENGVIKSKYFKEKEDLVYALQWCYNKRARYTVLFQDDALPLPDFMTRLKFVLQKHMLYHKHDWAFLKLFYPPKWQGWSNELISIQELLSTSLMIGALITTIITLLLKSPCTKYSSHLNKCNFFILFVLSFIFALYTLWTLGRPHWLVFLGSISTHLNFVVPAPGCCIPAVLYPQEHIQSLVNYLKSVNCSSSFPADIALDRFVNSYHLKQFLVVPDLVKHIGFVSSLGKGWKDPTEFRF